MGFLNGTSLSLPLARGKRSMIAFFCSGLRMTSWRRREPRGRDRRDDVIDGVELFEVLAKLACVEAP